MKKHLFALILALSVSAHADTLIFDNGQIARCHQSGGYAKTDQVDLSETPYASVPSALIGYVSSQIATGETLGQVVIESTGSVATSYTNQLVTNSDSTITTNSVPATYRPVLSASCTISAPSGGGQRLQSISSEALPSTLRDGLLAAWAYVTGLP